MTITQARAVNGRVARWAWSSPLWLQASAIYLAIRFVSWVLLEIAAQHQVWNPAVTGPSEGHINLALSWDAKWYERIATDGYPDHLPVGPDGRVQQNPWAFYPAFPYTVRLVMALTGGSFATVAPLLALAAGLGAAILMAHLFRATLPARGAGAALGAVAVWAAAPSSPVLQMAYTESFAMLLLIAFLLLVVKHQWWAAGACALLLGVTRPIALPLAVVIVVSAYLRWREGRLTRSEGAGLGFAVVATGLSGLLWTTIAWIGTGQRNAYTQTMTAWRGDASIKPWDPWERTISWAWKYTTGDMTCSYPGCERVTIIPAISILVPLALSLVILIPRVAPNIDVRLKVWAAAYALYLLAVVDGSTSIIRYLVPLFPLALVLVGAHREPRRRRVSIEARTAFWVLAGLAGQVGWIWWLVVFSPLPGGGDFPP